jgi:hypothetical protein
MNPMTRPAHASHTDENLQKWRAANPKDAFMTHMTYMDYGKITASSAARTYSTPAAVIVRRLKRWA